MPSTSMLFVNTIPFADPNKKEIYSWVSNFRHSEDWHTTYSDEEVKIQVNEFIKQFNSDITSRANERKKNGKNIRAVDLNSVITDVNSQLIDGVHPNNIGYKAMGEYLAKIISDYLNDNKL
jgi:lysophospholipase L1-like esterase